MPRGKFDSTNQGHYPDLGSDTSSAVPDPDLEIRRGRRSSRPLDKGGSGLPKKFFGPFGPQFGLKIRGGPVPLGPSPGSATDQYRISALVSQMSFGGETSSSVAKCRLFSQAKSNTG